MERTTVEIRKYKVITAVVAATTLFSGGMVYLLFRPSWLLVFDWLEVIGIRWMIDLFRFSESILPEWVEYSLPDGLWVYSYTLCIGCIWNFNIKKCWPYLAVLFAVVLTDEFLQKYHLVPGTYDFFDLLSYSTGAIMGVMHLIVVNNLINKQYYGNRT